MLYVVKCGKYIESISFLLCLFNTFFLYELAIKEENGRKGFDGI